MPEIGTAVSGTVASVGVEASTHAGSPGHVAWDVPQAETTIATNDQAIAEQRKRVMRMVMAELGCLSRRIPRN